MTLFITAILSFFTTRFSIAAAAIVAFTLITTTFIAAMSFVLSGIDFTSIPTFIQNGLHVMPSNTDDCFSILIATRVAGYLYSTQMTVIELRS